ncbi:MAG TPA: DMT family transporter [Alphaproteobacteria bacterium]|nr:DMT family transporter [Alphaproteobacteria bacterium]
MTRASFSAPSDNARLGIAYMLGSAFLFNIVNALAKWLSADYSIIEITFFRSFFAFIPCLIAVASGPGIGALRTQRPWLHLFRGSAGFTSTLLAFTSFSLLPIADAVAISFATPLFLTALSVPMLGEKVGVYRWSAVIVGFLGVMVMARPSGTGASLGFTTAVASTVLNALIMITVRRLGRTEMPITILFYQALICTTASTLLLPFGWTMPTLADFALFVLLGLVGFAGQFCQTQAFRYGPVAVVGPFNYTGLVWATVFGYLVWSDLPGPRTILGGSIVIASGIYILYRETRRAVAVVSAVPPQSG